jgi:mono/diheme cytochrome c family protein
MSPEQVYVMVCAACHEPDGRGALARKTMKDAETIPDLTDRKWQASRTDADLEKSVLEGKGKIMLPRKDILGLAHVDAKEMVALMRRFQDGKQVISGAPAGQPPMAPSVPVAAATAAPAPVASPLAPATPPAQPTPLAGANPPGSTRPAQAAAVASPALTPTALAPTPAPSASQPAIASGPSATVPPSPGLAPPVAAGPSPSATGPGVPLPPALPVSTAPSPEQAAKLQVASAFFRANCFACHGLDGTGNLVRPLMPVIPDFTNHQWQLGRSDTQLRTSVLDGKGTLMPGWHGKITPELAKDLVSFVRTLGAPELLASSAESGAPDMAFESRLRELKSQRDEIERQLRALDLPRSPSVR